MSDYVHGIESDSDVDGELTLLEAWLTLTTNTPRDTYRHDESPSSSVFYVVDEIENPHASIVRTREENYFVEGGGGERMEDASLKNVEKLAGSVKL